jgi:DNA (cytosine-5)-methyltransferase 1
MSGKYTVISTFAGCGGSSLGYKWAGFKELLAIDFDRNAVETFRLNFPEVPCWQKDITTVKANKILEFCNIKKGELDILDGSPPCQGFSTAGKRQVIDPRNELFKSFVYLIQELQPKIFVMENVSGMVKGKMKGRFKEIILSLKALNYQVKCKLLNAKYYEVPQSRQRLFFIGVRNDLNLQPVFPEPLSRVVTVECVLKELKNTQQDRLYPRGALIDLVSKTKQGETASKYHKKGNYFGTHRLCWNQVSPTLIKTAGATMNLLLHPEINAGISINEAKRLCSYPDSFKMIGNYKEQWARLGNSVMPKQMYHIAKTLKEKILDKYYGKTRN